MEITAYILAFFIGITLGLVGSGGTILTVPLLVYLLKVKPVNATHYSMFIVGTTACIGVLIRFNQKLPDFKTALQFLIPSLISLFLTRKFLMPAIPDHINVLNIISISKSVLLMSLFAFVMLAASFTMIKDLKLNSPIFEKENLNNPFSILFTLVAIIIGILTGLLGAGGGFLIVPALIYIKKNDMHTAIGTSLFIITINSLIGFVSDLHSAIQWHIVISIAILSAIGMLVGWKISSIIPNEKLKRIFGYTVMCLGIFILLKEWA